MPYSLPQRDYCQIRQIIALAIVLAWVSATHGQDLKLTPAEIEANRAAARELSKQRRSFDADAELIKMQNCRNSPNALIGLSASEVTNKCGRLYRTNRTVTAQGSFDQLVYGYATPGGPYLYIHLDNDVVTAVHSR